MAVATIFSGTFCRGEEVASRLADELEYRVISDNEVIGWVVEHRDASDKDLAGTIAGRRALFPWQSQDQRRRIAYLKEALAEVAADDNIVHRGSLGHLLPGSVSHVLKVCLVGSMEYRLAVAMEEESLAAGAARKEIRRRDLELAEWTKQLFEKGPWDKTLYDVKIPMHTRDVGEAVAEIARHARSDVIQTTEASRQAWSDFRLAAKAGTILAEQGHDVEVVSRHGQVTVELNKYVVRFGSLSKRLEETVSEIAGVAGVTVLPGPKFRAGYLVDEKEYALPAKVLLVDDEEEYVQTLSERLRMRDIGTTTVYSGEGALEAIEADEPEVIVLDLRMPGIDGMEVLRQVKRTRPHVEVIVLTGHGSEQDETLARELGAFAYLEKPVNFERLTETLQRAYEKIRRDRKRDQNG